MPITPVPVLGTQGFATDSVTKFSTLMAHLYLSDVKQTQLYPNQITSLSAIMEKSGADLSAIISNLKNDLATYFSRYYTSATVDATVANPDDVNGDITVQLTIKVYDDGQELIQAWQFNSSNNVITNVLNLSNNGG